MKLFPVEVLCRGTFPIEGFFCDPEVKWRFPIEGCLWPVVSVKVPNRFAFL